MQSDIAQVEKHAVTQIIGEMERESSQEANHSAENFKVSSEMPKALKCKTRKTSVKLSRNKEWEKFEKDINKILNTVARNVERKLSPLPTIICNILQDRFSIVKRKNTPKNKLKHREERINQIAYRKELRILRNS